MFPCFFAEPANASEKEKNRSPDTEAPARKKSRVAKLLTWKQNRQRQLRMECKPYTSRRKKDGMTVTKAQREFGPRCTSSACKSVANRFCVNFNEETTGRSCLPASGSI